MVGDWGDDNDNQYAVAEAMSQWCDPDIGGEVCDFIINTGDNFYPSGVNASNDPRFNTTWKDIYNRPNIADIRFVFVDFINLSLSSSFNGTP